MGAQVLLLLRVWAGLAHRVVRRAQIAEERPEVVNEEVRLPEAADVRVRARGGARIYRTIGREPVAK